MVALLNPAAVGVLAYAALALVSLRVLLSYKSAVYAVRRVWRWADEWSQAYQYHEVPRFLGLGSCDGGVENPLFRKAVAYVSSLPSLEDADAASLVSSGGRISLQLGPGHTVRDAFLGARLAWSWTNEHLLVLRLRRHDRTRVLRPYLQHVESVADQLIVKQRRDLRLFLANAVSGGWASAPLTHPATLDTQTAMDPELKARIRADLDAFLKGRAYYHRLGRVWRRTYLLYGPPGTGKSTFAAAMARHLAYDVYEIDLNLMSSSDVVDLRALLLRTTPRSLILVEDLDRYLLHFPDRDRHGAVLSFMDGLSSCCGEERVMVFTMTTTASMDPAVLRPGRLDVHIHFTLCDFQAFKAMAANYLGIKDHKLYPQVEEGFLQAGARLSPAELGEIMLANRASPSRALRNVITKLHHHVASLPHRRNASWSGHQQHWDEQVNGSGTEPAQPAQAGVFARDAPMREFKKLYGLIKIRSRREEADVLGNLDRER